MKSYMAVLLGVVLATGVIVGLRPAQAAADSVLSQCLVLITGDLAISPSSPHDQLVAHVDRDCTVTTQRVIETTFAPASLSSFTGCQSRNLMESNTTWITRLSTFLEFDSDGQNVTSVTRHSPDPWAAWPYYLDGTPVQTGDIATPKWDIWVQHQQAFGYHDPFLGDQYNHTKSNEAHGYGDGTCATRFAHWNYVCGPCDVKFDLLYY